MKNHWPILVLAATVLFAFYPAWLLGKIPLNGRNLAAFYSPWLYQQFENFPTGVPSKPGMPDQLRLYYPYMYLTQTTYRRLELPLWNPHNFAGNPHMAEMQSGVFYPLHLLLPLLPLPIYWTLFQITGFFLGSLFTYLYLRSLQLDKLSSLFGGLTFTFSTFMFTWSQEVIIAPHSILWLPLILLSTDKVLARSTGWRNFWALGLFSLSMSILSGYWQTTFYVILTTLAYIIFRCFQTRSTGRAWLLLSWYPLSLGLTAFQLFPTAQLYQLSSRPLVNTAPQLIAIFKQFLLQPFHAVLLLIPDFFGHPTTRNFFGSPVANYYELSLFVGTIPIVFVFSALGRRHSLIWFFTLLGLISASFAFDLPHSRLIYDLNIPLLSTGIAHRVLFLPSFVFSVLAAFGFHHWLKPKTNRPVWVSAALVTLIFAALWIFLYKTFTVHPENLNWPYAPELAKYVWPFNPKLAWWRIAIRNTVIPTAVWLAGLGLLIAAARLRRLRLLLVVTIIILSLAQNLYQFFKFTPFAESQFVYPSHPTIEFLQTNAGFNRYSGYHNPVIGSNFATYYGLYSIEGFDSLNERLRTQLIHSATRGPTRGQLTVNLPRSADAILDRDYTTIHPRRLMSLLAVKYLIDYPKDPDLGDTTKVPDLPPDEQKLVWQEGDWKIYEYIPALPRAFLASSYLKATDPQITTDLIYDPKVNLREQLILVEDPPFILADDPDESAEIISYRPTKVVIQTSSQTNQLLFLSDTYYPGWQATIDGQPTSILRADLAFRAIPVPAGQHKIIMTYFPDSFRNGLLIAAAALILSLCVYRFFLKPA